MRLKEFKEIIKKAEPLLADGTIDVTSYRLFILKKLPLEHADEARLTDIFSQTTINLLIEQGQKIINTGHGESFILGGESVNFSDYRDRYLEIFSIWQKNKWIKIEEQPDGNIKIILNC
ncbi:hypothetical protein FE772_18325 [Lysobacter enzymogenes]|nr:hypothetical protein [Lysobacter enzymogenes]QCW27303.1 hypothetical protein FE772_18325 [Lysobacter enzymogenes]